VGGRKLIQERATNRTEACSQPSMTLDTAELRVVSAPVWACGHASQREHVTGREHLDVQEKQSRQRDEDLAYMLPKPRGA
jgi:hypothetical protein